MGFHDEIKNIRQNCFLSQDAFANALQVSFSTINRWETGKTIPNYVMMQKFVAFCEKNNIDHKAVDMDWKEARNGTANHR